MSTQSKIPFDTKELKRYNRHFLLPQVGIAGQAKLKAARVLCVGAGGLGSPLLLYLAAAGIGTLGIVEDDIVDDSNLQRQILYSTNEVQQKKILAATARLQQLNPYITIETHDIRLSAANALTIISQYDMVADGTDNYVTRYLINDACFHLKKPHIYAGIFQFEGQCSIFNAPGGPCYRCLYDAPPPSEVMPNCAEGGVLGVLPGLLGTIQATEVIKLILGIGTPLIGRLLTVNSLDMQFREFTIHVHSQCSLCTYQQAFDLLPHHDVASCSAVDESDQEITVNQLQAIRANHTDFILLDVRDAYEYDIANIGGYLIPLAELINRLHELDKNKLIIVHCKSGTRSRQAVKLLQHAGFLQVKNLQGGIIAWAKQLDPRLAVY